MRARWDLQRGRSGRPAAHWSAITHAAGMRPQQGKPGAARPRWGPSGAAAGTEPANGFANNDPGPVRTQVD
jgi:hypothetical protein